MHDNPIRKHDNVREVTDITSGHNTVHYAPTTPGSAAHKQRVQSRQVAKITRLADTLSQLCDDVSEVQDPNRAFTAAFEDITSLAYEAGERRRSLDITASASAALVRALTVCYAKSKNDSSGCISEALECGLAATANLTVYGSLCGGRVYSRRRY